MVVAFPFLGGGGGGGGGGGEGEIEAALDKGAFGGSSKEGAGCITGVGVFLGRPLPPIFIPLVISPAEFLLLLPNCSHQLSHVHVPCRSNT